MGFSQKKEQECGIMGPTSRLWQKPVYCTVVMYCFFLSFFFSYQLFSLFTDCGIIESVRIVNKKYIWWIFFSTYEGDSNIHRYIMSIFLTVCYYVCVFFLKQDWLEIVKLYEKDNLGLGKSWNCNICTTDQLSFCKKNIVTE